MKRLACLVVLLGCSHDRQSSEYQAHVVRANQFAERRPIGQQCPEIRDYNIDGRDKSGVWRWDSVVPVGAKIQLRDKHSGVITTSLCTLTGWAKDSPEEEEYLKQALGILHRAPADHQH